MKLIRFIKKLFNFLHGEFTFPIIGAVIMASVLLALSYAIGWVAMYFGMEPPKSKSGVFDNTSGLGIVLMMMAMMVAVVIVWICRFFNWLKDMWRDS